MSSDYRFHHLGIATRNIEKTAKIYHELGYVLAAINIEPSQNVKIGFLSKPGSPVFELVEPLNADSPVSRIVESSGTTPYHICFEVEDIRKAIDELEGLRFRLLFEPTQTETMEPGLFCYLFSADTGLIELYEQAKE
jgi:methylmalonyl-CoA/ethylmalonyl-CoA epimerase